MSLKKCCVNKCPNTSTNSQYSFFNFPTVQYRYRRLRWIRAVRKLNGSTWKPKAQSFVCGSHFVTGEPSMYRNYENYVPTIFDKSDMQTDELWSSTVSVKQYALEYIKHDALLERPTNDNVKNEQRKYAYSEVARALAISPATARVWERRFRDYFENKMAALAKRKLKPGQDSELPDWISAVEQRLHVMQYLQDKAKKSRCVSPGGVVSALVAAARLHGALCSSQLYHDARRALRLGGAPYSMMHAVWVQAQRVCVAQVVAAGRGGDRPPAPPRDAAAVADLVLLHTDLTHNALLTNESVELYEESEALHTLWRLVQRHRLEEAVPRGSRVRAQRWTRAYRDYLNSGRVTSIVVLQRRWHELKLQARERLAAHWRRGAGAGTPGAPATAPPWSAPPWTAPPWSAAAAPPWSAAASPPWSAAAQAPAGPPVPQPALIHISILKRYPHIATVVPTGWRRLVLQGLVVTEPLESDMEEADAESSLYDVVDLSGDEPLAPPSPPSADLGDLGDLGDLSDLTDLTDPTDPTDFTPADGVKAEESGSMSDEADNLVMDAPAHHNTQYTINAEQTEYTTTTENTALPEHTTYKENAHIDELTEDVCPASPAAIPTLHVLNQIDPTTVESEIIFDTDDEQEQPCADNKTFDIPLTGKQERIRNRLVFDDDLPDDDVKGSNDVVENGDVGGSDDGVRKSEVDAKGDVAAKTEVDEKSYVFGNTDVDNKSYLVVKNDVDMKSDVVVKKDSENVDSNRDEAMKDCEGRKNLSSFDSKLLLESRVVLMRVDELPAWNKHARDNTIDVSRIISELPAPHRPDSVTYEVFVDKDGIELVPRTRTHRAGAKRQLAQQPAAPADSDSEDELPLKFIKQSKHQHNVDTTLSNVKNKRSKIIVTVERQRNGDKRTTNPGERNRDELSPAFPDEEFFSGKRVIESRRYKGPHSAASTLEWSEQYAGVYGEGGAGAGAGGPGGAGARGPGGAGAGAGARGPGGAGAGARGPGGAGARGPGGAHKRVQLPDIEHVRRVNSGLLTAQVAPITAAIPSDDEPSASLSGEHEGAEWCDDSMPPPGQLDTVLAELTSACAAQQVLQAAHCCAARRHRSVNDARRRIGLPHIPLHKHASGACECCCAHLCDDGARARLAAQLRALHDDIANMLQVSSVTSSVKNQSKKPKEKGIKKKVLPQKEARSPSPSSIFAVADVDPPASAKHNTMPVPPLIQINPSATPTASAEPTRLKTLLKDSGPRRPADATSLAKADGYDEWMRQKTLCAPYFLITPRQPHTDMHNATLQSLLMMPARMPNICAMRKSTQSPAPTTLNGTTSQSTQSTNTTPDSHVSPVTRNTMLRKKIPTKRNTKPPNSTIKQRSTLTCAPQQQADAPVLDEAAKAASTESCPTIVEVSSAGTCIKIEKRSSTDEVETENEVVSVKHKGMPDFVPVAPKPSRCYPPKRKEPGADETVGAVEIARSHPSASDENMAVMQNMLVSATRALQSPSSPLSVRIAAPRGSRMRCVVTLNLPAADTVDLTGDDDPPDAGSAPPERGRTPPDGGSTPPDGGSTLPDGGSTLADDGSTPPDGGSTPPDGGSTLPDGGSTPPDGGSTLADGGSTPPDDGSTPPDGAGTAPQRPDNTQPDGAEGPQSEAPSPVDLLQLDNNPAENSAPDSNPGNDYTIATNELIKTLEEIAKTGRKNAYEYKPDCAKLSATQLPCGAVLCIDGDAAPLAVGAKLPGVAGPAPAGARAGPAGAGSLVLTSRRLPLRAPTFWSLAPYAAVARVLPPALLSHGDAHSCPKAACACDQSNHQLNVLTAVASVQQLCALMADKARLFLMSVPRGKHHPLHIQRRPPHT